MTVVAEKNDKMIDYIGTKFKVMKHKEDKHKVVGVRDGHTMILFKGSKKECEKKIEDIHEAYKAGCILFYFK